jgi:hypothetical protein
MKHLAVVLLMLLTACGRDHNSGAVTKKKLVQGIYAPVAAGDAKVDTLIALYDDNSFDSFIIFPDNYTKTSGKYYYESGDVKFKTTSTSCSGLNTPEHNIVIANNEILTKKQREVKVSLNVGEVESILHDIKPRDKICSLYMDVNIQNLAESEMQRLKEKAVTQKAQAQKTLASN